VSATPTVSLSPTPSLTPTPPVSLLLAAFPSAYTPGGLLDAAWQIEGLSEDLSGLSLEIDIPPGFTPQLDAQGSVGSKGVVVLPVEAAEGRLRLRAVDDLEGS
jgi:hypothetical protein